MITPQLILNQIIEDEEILRNKEIILKEMFETLSGKRRGTATDEW